jgi:hypothetical protein
MANFRTVSAVLIQHDQLLKNITMIVFRTQSPIQIHGNGKT